jgi:hypothetical protein
MDAANVRRDFRRVLRLVPGLAPVDWTPRELRHSLVSLLSNAEVPIEQIYGVEGEDHADREKRCGMLGFQSFMNPPTAPYKVAAAAPKVRRFKIVGPLHPYDATL